MNILMGTDGYHMTMGYLIGDGAMEQETHILYARTGGPLVVPNLSEVIAEYLSQGLTQADVDEADAFWTDRGVPFAVDALGQIAAMPSLPISVRGVRDGEVVMPGEPIAVVSAPAVLAAVPESYLIASMGKSVQVATRYTKVAKALGWERERMFEVGMRAAGSVADHNDTVRLLAELGLGMTSSGIAARAASITAGGSMGHRYTQRYSDDYSAFADALDRVLAYKRERGIKGKVKLSFLLDTRDTLRAGLPAAIRVMKERFAEIVEHVELSVRLDSGDLAAQLVVVIRAFQSEFGGSGWLPGIILESGLTPEDLDIFERIAAAEGHPRNRLGYGIGEYVAGGTLRSFTGMVYKLSSVAGRPKMKFADEEGGAKESYPGNVTLVEREVAGEIERMIALVEERGALAKAGWSDRFIDIARDGVLVAPQVSRRERNERIKARWESVARGYIGNERRPAQFQAKPKMSAGVSGAIRRLRQQANVAQVA